MLFRFRIWPLKASDDIGQAGEVTEVLEYFASLTLNYIRHRQQRYCYIFCFEFLLPDTLKHVARTVAHVNLSDHLVNVVFTLFDENG